MLANRFSNITIFQFNLDNKRVLEECKSNSNLRKRKLKILSIGPSNHEEVLSGENRQSKTLTKKIK